MPLHQNEGAGRVAAARLTISQRGRNAERRAVLRYRLWRQSPWQAEYPHAVFSTEYASMTQLFVRSIALGLTIAMAAQTARPEQTAADVAVIPQPVSVERGAGAFELKADTPLVWIGGDPAIERVARQLAVSLTEATGAAWQAKALEKAVKPAHAVVLTLGKGDHEEGYDLTITPDGVLLEARTPHGLFYGVQTLRQMLDSNPRGESRSLPAVTIADYPRYNWRGMHLDVCRHFMSAEFVRKYIDLLAYHKYNVFHWHLTDDQGWRIEIKKYPKLTEVGAWRMQDGQRYGGFYTQDEVRQIVAYAAERFITVVPEIEMPGHAKAALASYPELSCAGVPLPVEEKWGVFKEVFCAGNDETFAFLEGVLSEVLGLFPSEFIHVGGDECPKELWKECPKCQARIKAEKLANEEELQSYFVQRMGKFLSSRGRRLLGWDEILEGGLAPNATVMSWRGNKGGIAAAQQGHDVVMSPTTHCYFDYRISSKPEHTGARYAKTPLTLPMVYSFEPTPPELNAEQAKHVLGGQGNVWTEFMPDEKRVEFMVFPRACALAEVLWTPPNRRNFDDFRTRMELHEKRLAALGVNFPRLAELP
jgi:hexosaminidase